MSYKILIIELQEEVTKLRKENTRLRTELRKEIEKEQMRLQIPKNTTVDFRNLL